MSRRSVIRLDALQTALTGPALSLDMTVHNFERKLHVDRKNGHKYEQAHWLINVFVIHCLSRIIPLVSLSEI